jgi:Spy/CpxP family protein refolding chaperone
MFRGLNLTEDQQARMQQIRENFKQRIAPLREQMRATRGTGRRGENAESFNEAQATQRMIAAAPLRAKLMGESFRMRQEMLAVLTPEQRAQMEQKRAERKARWGERRGDRGNGTDRGGRSDRGSRDDRDDDSDEQ